MFMLETQPKSRLLRSQSSHSSEEAGQCRWSEGLREGGCVTPDSCETTPVQVPRPAGAKST